MSVELERVGWEDGTQVTPARVTIGGTTYDVTDATYSGTTPLSAQNLKAMENNTENAINEVQNNLDEASPSCIYCRPSADKNLTNEYYVVPSWETREIAGDGITINNSGKIIIGSNVNHVRITAKWFLSTGASQTAFYHYLLKNGSSIDSSWCVATIPASRYFVAFNQAVVSVTEGDEIGANLYGQGVSMNHNHSNFIVEKID